MPFWYTTAAIKLVSHKKKRQYLAEGKGKLARELFYVSQTHHFQSTFPLPFRNQPLNLPFGSILHRLPPPSFVRENVKLENEIKEKKKKDEIKKKKCYNNINTARTEDMIETRWRWRVISPLAYLFLVRDEVGSRDRQRILINIKLGYKTGNLI